MTKPSEWALERAREMVDEARTVFFCGSFDCGYAPDSEDEGKLVAAIALALDEAREEGRRVEGLVGDGAAYRKGYAKCLKDALAVCAEHWYGIREAIEKLEPDEGSTTR